MLLSTSVPLSEIASAASRSFDNASYHFQLEREDGAAYLACSPGNLVALLNTTISQVIDQILLVIPSVEFDFYIARQSWSKVFRSRTSAEKNPILNTRVNIYTYPSNLIDLGRILSAKKLYLQRPSCSTPGKSYQNPHHVTFLGIEPRTLEEEHEAKARPDTDDTTEATAEKELDKDDLKNEFAVVFGSLIRSHCLSELAADRRVKTNLTP
jgi:SWI/SNF-related matrix-associated actin-dependent regulator of chromatin subfamily A3